jgi:16S rRNA (guanine(966)-N(2))-methyltransferase RsmD
MRRGRGRAAGALRVIAGRLKGRRLAAPHWEGVRPTSDRLRETLFDVLAPRVAGTRFVDGFAGTGAVGIEALSRGATAVTFVEADPRACSLIAANLAGCGVSDGYTVVARPWERSADLLARGADIVFLDPPYAHPDLQLVLNIATAVASPGGLVVLEHDRRRLAPEPPIGWTRARQVRAGDSALSFYAPTGAGDVPAEEIEP